jgi:hypothetical protein
MAVPWTNVLEKSCAWAKGKYSSDSAAGSVTGAVFNSGYKYDDANGAPQYSSGGLFDLTKCLSEWGSSSKNVNCWDTANMVCIFSNALGCNLQRYYITGGSGGFYLNYIKPIGRSWTNDPFTASGRNPFGLHWTAWSEIYDACLQVDVNDPPTSSPFTGELPVNMTFNAGTPSIPYDDYRGRLVDPADVNSVSGTSLSPSSVK